MNKGMLAATRAVVARPRLWPVAVSTARSLVGRHWWRQPPFLPLPDRHWLRFRLVTAYGGDGRQAMAAEDVITYLEWRRSFPR